MVSTARPSLERLKALDSLPSFERQLEEAEQLCTHSARADMTLKWLLDKLKTSDTARASEASWELLSTAFRLLAPERLATLLGSANILSIFRNGAIECKQSGERLLVVSDCVNLLLELSSAPQGAPLKAVLSTDAAVAAKFTGAWLDAVDEARFDTSDKACACATDSLLDPALQVWSLRKRRGDDNDLFADACLAAAAYVLDSVSPRSGEPSGKRKRKRAGEMTATGRVRALESLVAKHVFLPARAAFVDQQQRSGVSAESADPYTGPTPDLQKRFAQYKAAKPKEDDPLDSRMWRYHSTAEVLLDIALRCLPASTPVHRLKERPWVEAVFVALLDCALGYRQTGLNPDPWIIVQMLPVVRKHALSLSRDMLTNVAEKHSRTSGTSEFMYWQLIAEVLRMDANVYTNRAMAQRLFNEISSAHHALARKDQPHELVNLDHSTSLFDTWRDDIATPIMQVFAQNRDLVTFIDLWHEQLHGDFTKQRRCTWLELKKSLAPLVERHLTETQIVDCVARFHGSVSAAQANDQSPKTIRAAQIERCASIVVLDGILSGVRSTGLVGILQRELETLFQDLLKLFEQDAAAAAEYPQIWALCTTAFELWMPSWVAMQASRESLIDRASEILSSRMVQQAEATATAATKMTGATASVEQVTSEAGSFLTCLSSTLHHYDDSGRALNAVDEIVPQTDLQHNHHILRFPTMLEKLRINTRNDLIFDWMEAAYEPVLSNLESDPDDLTPMDQIRAAITTACNNAQTAVVEDLVRIGLASFEAKSLQGEPSDFDPVSIGLQVLLELPVTALSTSQRKRILDGAAALKYRQKEGHETLQAQLLLMVRMLELPCPEAAICTDTAALWTLGGPPKIRDNYDTGMPLVSLTTETDKTLELLEQLVHLVMKQLISRQGQAAGQSILLALASEVKHQVGVLCDRDLVDNDERSLSILRVVLSHLDSSLGPELKGRCLDAAVIGAYAKYLVGTAEKLHLREQGGNISREPWLLQILNALVDMPKIVNAPGSTIDLRSKLTALVSDVLDARSAKLRDAHAITTPRERTMVVRCVQLICRWDLTVDDEVVSDVAALTLDEGLEPQEHAALLTAVHHGCIGRYSQAGAMKSLLGRLLPSDALASASQLILLQVAISTLSECQFAEPADSVTITPQEILHRLLRLAEETQDLTVRRRACACIITVLREKPFMTNQYAIERVVSTLHGLVLVAEDPNGVTYLDACRIFTLLLQQYRSRLKDRMNLLVPLLQALISRLFGSSTGLQATRKGLSVRHARVLARTLQSLCNPPQMRGRSKISDLVDEARKAQAHVGQYMQFALHHYCKQVLQGTLAEGVNDAIRPGLWAIIEAMQANDANSRWVLSAAMSGGEREQLSRVYHDYETFGKGESG